jgi:hypothetical protein
MTDDENATAAETPIQRALRMKKTALEAKRTPGADGRLQRKENAGIAAGKSKPWMKK